MSEHSTNDIIFDPPWKNTSYYCHNLPTEPLTSLGTILVTGASGYIGRRLVPELLVRGYKVRIMLRGESSEFKELWPEVDVVVADALDKNSLEKAMEGTDTAYYLMHSTLLGLDDFEEMEKQAPINFREVAEEKNVNRIIYLGDMEGNREGMSSLLKQRIQVVRELQKGKVPVTILRSSIIIGPGSASYEILKHLVKALPIILVPRWARNKSQPIAVSDVVKYLVGILEIPDTSGMSFDIGGEQVLTYTEMMQILAKLHNLKRVFIPFPYSKSEIYSYLAGILTPVPTPITRFMIEKLKNDVICRDTKITNFLSFKHKSFQATVIKAMTREEQDRIYSRWTDAYPPAHELAIKLCELNNYPFYTALYSMETKKKASSLFKSVCKVGGKEGWFSKNWMWNLRGLIDRMFYGVGTSRGRKSQISLKVNDVIGFWRVEDIQPDRRLLLRAEMKLPGKAWLEFTIQEKYDIRVLTVIPYYHTSTFFGKIYWYLFLPFHQFIFKDLIKQIEKRS